MRQFSLTQLLMFVALVAILLTLAKSEGCRMRYSMIGSMEFSSDGKQLLVARYDARHAGVPGKGYKDEACRTISIFDAETAALTPPAAAIIEGKIYLVLGEAEKAIKRKESFRCKGSLLCSCSSSSWRS